MADFKKDAADLLEYIGGPDNISAVSHCATRMRFVLNDPSEYCISFEPPVRRNKPVVAEF